MAAGNGLRGELLDREVDHLNWAKKVSTFLTDDRNRELSIQLDHTQCALGHWLFGDGRKCRTTITTTQVSDLLEEIASASNEQAQGIRQAAQRQHMLKRFTLTLK